MLRIALRLLAARLAGPDRAALKLEADQYLRAESGAFLTLE